MITEELANVAALIRAQRQAALATLRDGAPFVSMVAYAPEPDFGGLLLHLSRLAAHTGQLLANPAASLLICEGDDGRDDVQTLARITLAGAAEPVAQAGVDAARDRYLARLPAAAQLFALPDFTLFRSVPREARYVGGFARAFSLTADDLRQAAGVKGQSSQRSQRFSYWLLGHFIIILCLLYCNVFVTSTGGIYERPVDRKDHWRGDRGTSCAWPRSA